MSKIWRDIRGILHGAVASAVAKLLAGLLALFGAASAVDPGLPAALHGAHVVPDAPAPRQ